MNLFNFQVVSSTALAHKARAMKPLPSRFSPTLLAVTTLVTAASLLAGCKDEPKGAPAAPTVTGAPAPTHPPQTQGTNDGGGCTGTDARCFDSYIKDPTTLPAYLRYVRPILLNVQPDRVRTEPLKMFETIARSKTWYIAPVDLETLAPETLGVPYRSADGLDQIAIQTLRAIWIDERPWKKMAERNAENEQGDAVLHEIMMQVYLLKFRKMSEISQQLRFGDRSGGQTPAPTDTNHSIDADVIDQAMPPEPWHALNDQDNESIRAAVGYLKSHASVPLPFQTLSSVLRDLKFDARIFSVPASAETGPGGVLIPLNAQQIANALEGTRLTGRMPSLCQGFRTRIEAPCRIEVVAAGAANGANGHEIRIAAGSNAIGRYLLTPESRNNLTKNGDRLGRDVLTLTLIESEENIAVGSRLSTATFLFRELSAADARPLELISVIVRPALVTAIIPDATAHLGRRCEIRSPEANGLMSEPVRIIRSLAPDLSTQVLETIFANWGPYAACAYRPPATPSDH